MRRWSLKLVLGMLSMLVMPGCAKIDEIYYVSTENPDSGITLYYRVRIKGKASTGKAKYSVGFYDRAAVERLFAENTLEREYLSTKLDVFDPKTGNRLADLAAELERTERGYGKFLRERADNAHSTVAGLLGTYDTVLSARKGLAEAYAVPLQRARKAWEQAGAELKKPGSACEANDTERCVRGALSHLREAQAILETIRIAVDGRVLVRHFDGAGNEINTDEKTLLIFVANDVSRFAEAIRQLAESEETTKDVINIVLGRKVAEVQRMQAQLRLGADDHAAKVRYMDETLKSLGEPTTDQLKPEQLKHKQDKLKQTIANFAQVVSDKVGEFASAQEIRAYAEGME